jgi:hypothetical protein
MIIASVVANVVENVVANVTARPPILMYNLVAKLVSIVKFLKIVKI